MLSKHKISVNREPKIKNLLFDVGGVIILNKKINLTKFDKKWSLPKGTVKRIIDSCFKEMSLNQNFNLEKYLSDNFSHYLSFKQYQEVADQLFRRERINKSLINWIRKMRKEYNICLLTNNTAVLEKLLKKKFKIYNDFDYIFNSAEVGFLKPSPEFFRYVLRELKASPKQCLLVDDNPVNIKSAEEVGLNVILFTNNKEFFNEISKFNL